MFSNFKSLKCVYTVFIIIKKFLFDNQLIDDNDIRMMIFVIKE